MASIACLKPNVLTLSGACQQALGAVAGVTNTAATAAVAPPAAEPAPLLVTPREELFIGAQLAAPTMPISAAVFAPVPVG